jgi:hypothetical protein
MDVNWKKYLIIIGVDLIKLVIWRIIVTRDDGKCGERSGKDGET